MGASYSVLAAAPEQRAAAIGDIAATEFEDLTSAIVENTEASRVVKGMLQVLNNTHPGVLEDINLQLGFVRGEVNASTKTAPLPPELQEFQVLAERSSVEVVLKDEKFPAAVTSVQVAPDNETAVAALGAECKRLASAYKAAIGARGREKNLTYRMRKVVEAGNEDFLKVYSAMWAMVQKSEPEGCQKYHEVLGRIQPLEINIKQRSSNAAKLYQQAARVAPTFQKIVHEAVQGLEGVRPKFPKGLKKMQRIVEKAELKYRGNTDQVCDVNRCMLSCDSMKQVAAVLAIFANSPEIEITRLKDRFFHPSDGGWTDCMVNLRLKADSSMHVCEVQIVHEQMLTARQGLPGHCVYNRVRNASELMFFFRRRPQSKEELQESLIEYVQGDQCHRGPPNGWDVGQITDMSELFKKKELETFNEDISQWNTARVTDMRDMFRDAVAFDQPIGAWTTSSVTDFSGMFFRALSFDQPIGEWDTSGATTMKKMFYDAVAFDQPIGEWDTSRVTDMRLMFRGAVAFNQPLDAWMVANVIDACGMFSGASAFTHSVDEWHAPNVDKSTMFTAPQPQTKEELQRWLIDFVQGDQCKRGHPGNWDVSKIEDMSNLFNRNELKDFNEDISKWDTISVTNMRSMFNQGWSFAVSARS